MEQAISADVLDNEGSTALLETLHGKVQLPQGIEAVRASYRSAKPFPHVIIDNLFSPALLDRVIGEAPRKDQWVRIEHGLQRVERMRSALELGPASTELISVLHSAAFLYLLSEISGVWQLLPDPYLQGGGHALMHRGGFFQIHADRNVAYETGLRRRLAMIVFLNKDWPKEYGGQLELWDDQASRCEVSIDPVYNRTVLFEVAYPNYHGVPSPLACPRDRFRHSFLAYYHTAGAGDNVTPHASVFAPQFYQKKPSFMERAARQLAPPLVIKALKALRRGG